MSTDKRADIVLSVVIPVYNVEHYLTQCLESVLCNSEEALEIICIDDGSTDRSSQILQQYADRDSRIKLIVQENHGLSAARNRGAACASGTYILYVDSDDYVLKEEFLQLYRQLEASNDTEVFVTDFRMVNTVRGKIRAKDIFQIGTKNAPMYGLENLPKMLSKRQCFWNVWRFVYRRSFLVRNKIKFREGYLCEDIDYTTKVLLAEPKTVFLHCPFYCYRVRRKDSLMGCVSAKRVTDTVTLLLDSIAALNASGIMWRQHVIEQYQFEFFLTFAQLYEVKHSERPRVKFVLLEGLPILKIGTDRFSHIAYLLTTILGVPIIALGLFLLKKIKRNLHGRWGLMKKEDNLYAP